MAAKKTAKKTAAKATKVAKKSRGRPARAGEAATTGITVRFTEGELTAVRAHAAKAGITPTEWIRQRALS